MRTVVLDPRLLAVAFLDEEDEHGLYRLLGLLAYGRLCQYETFVAAAEETELLRQIRALTMRRGTRSGGNGGVRRGPSAQDLVAWARERAAVLAELLPPHTTPKDLVLVLSPALQDEVKYEIDRADDWAYYDEPELGNAVYRLVGAMTGVLVDGLGEDERASRRIDQEMLVAAVQAGAGSVLVTQSESLAPEDGETFQRTAPGTSTPVTTMRLWTFVDRYVNRYPFDLLRDVPHELLDRALR